MEQTGGRIIGWLADALPYVLGAVAAVLLLAFVDGLRARSPGGDDEGSDR